MTRRRCFAPSAAALAAGLCLAAVGCHRSGPPKADTSLPLVTVSAPKVDLVTAFTDLTGTLDASQTVEVRPRVSGYITRVNMTDGQFVQKDKTVLFEIDPVTYLADLKSSKADVKVKEADLELARADEARNKLGYDKGAVSKQELDSYVAKRAVAEAKLKASEAQVEISQQNLDWTKVTAPITGKADRAYLTPGNVATGGTTQGTVLTTIVALQPMWGYFDVDENTVLYYRKLIREGRADSADAPGELNEGRVPGASAGGVAAVASLRGLVPIEVQLRGEEGYPHKGTLDFVSNRLNPATGSLQIRGTFPNANGEILPGMFARARVPQGRPFESLLVPESAIVSDQGKRVLYVLGPDNRVEVRQVEFGPQSRGLRVVVEGVTEAEENGKKVRRGLARTDQVIIRGMQRVQPGMPVDPEPGAIHYTDTPPPSPLAANPPPEKK